MGRERGRRHSWPPTGLSVPHQPTTHTNTRPRPRQAVAPESRAPNAADVLRSVGVRTLDADQADAVLALRV